MTECAGACYYGMCAYQCGSCCKCLGACLVAEETRVVKSDGNPSPDSK